MNDDMDLIGENVFKWRTAFILLWLLPTRLAILGFAIVLAGCGSGQAPITLATPKGKTPARTLPQPRPMTPLLSNVVAFMGDSITFNWPLSDYDPNPTLNFGINGYSTNQMLARFSDVISAGPGVVVILGGTNDLAGGGNPEEILGNIKAMAEMADAAGIRVIFCSVMATTSSAPADHQNEQAIIELDQLILGLAQSRGDPYADYYDALILPDGLADPSLLLDGLHPNAAGYEKMWAVLAPLVAEELQ